VSVRRQLPWFVVFGVAASATHLVVALSTHRWLGLGPLVANTVAFCCALGVSYLGNAIVTFRVEPWRAHAFAKFAALSIVSFGLNQAIVYALTVRAGWPFALSLAVVLLTVPPFTFVMARVWALAE
jgi:putative flippase GtrA